ncbi:MULTISPECIES: phage transcriptional regulator, RinA family [Enterococcus]|uniref:phage transcriptional regulator, RinA family n=1 Tax=Enterococcus TaxID=1350 RepID=UPI00035C50DD|nr:MULTISPECIES: phage transcriptional regulator, RinA family [Enterococcus]EPH68315.1 phage transcriptional regulator, RinA family [Enterococcus faecium 13.SD.W.09]MCC4046493.1 integrase [Enterococcus gallinarum]MCD4961219.1 integrase [Enterococcus casseliflavus]SFE41458.1 phage transcriptional activator, RinA family [Enterococcus casseliflavus]
MEKWRVERVKAVLKDYRDTDKYVRKLEEEIRVPYREEDVNGDIKGTRSDSDLMFGTLWTIETDKQIRRLKRNKQIVQELLDECGSDTETIIRELYIKRFPQYTMQGLVEQRIILASVSTAKRLRNKFFEEVDKQLDL